jgi:hypothetical protein
MQSHCKKILGLATPAGALAAALVAAACEGHDPGHDHDHENEVISRVELIFTPTGGGAPLVFAFDDPDGDGGVSGSADTIELAAGVEYTLAVRFQNSLVDPPEDLTDEIKGEAEDHLVFVVGDVAGPAASAPTALVTHAYADVESDYGENAVGEDLPVGLIHTITGSAAGEGKLRVILRHLPEVNGQPQKTADLPADLAAGRDLPGSVDADVSFDLVVS